MNYTTLFYWLTVADNARVLFQWGAGIFTAIAVISTIVNIFCRGGSMNDANYEKEQKEFAKSADIARKWILWSYPFMFLWWCLLIFTPSKKDALLIVAGGQTLNFLTTDKSAKQIPSELSSFILTELKNQAKEAAVDLNIKDKKEKILEEAKNLSSKELLEKIKNDSIFAKVVLEK